jgi:hypothetical protein
LGELRVGASRLNLRLGATIYTDELDAVQNWLTKYFGFQSRVDWIDLEHKAGRVYCQRDGMEIVVCGVVERSAEVQLLVDDIAELSEQFVRDGIEHHVDRDIGERPVIHFPSHSAFAHFVIEARK